MDGTRYTLEENPTIFGKILRKEIPADIVYEDAKILVFKDINPLAKIHVLMIPKQHIQCLGCAGVADVDLLGYMMMKVPEIATLLEIQETGYRVITNIGENGGQEVPHLHFHILGGEKLGVMIG